MTADEIGQAIKAAFAPLSGVASHVCPSCESYFVASGGRTWMEVPCAHIEASVDRLPLLCAEGFAYYLPAHLLCAVTHPESETAHFTFYAVCPDKAVVEQPWMRDRFAALSESQLRAIFQFQDFIIEQGTENPGPAVLKRFRSRLRILASR